MDITIKDKCIEEKNMEKGYSTIQMESTTKDNGSMIKCKEMVLCITHQVKFITEEPGRIITSMEKGHSIIKTKILFKVALIIGISIKSEKDGGPLKEISKMIIKKVRVFLPYLIARFCRRNGNKI